MTTTKRPTKTACKAVLAAVRRKFHVTDEDIAAGYGPTLVMDWDWTGTPTPTVIWEGGPHDWAVEIENVFWPFGVFVEPYSGWALSIYRDSFN